MVTENCQRLLSQLRDGAEIPYEILESQVIQMITYSQLMTCLYTPVLQFAIALTSPPQLSLQELEDLHQSIAQAVVIHHWLGQLHATHQLL